MLPDIPERATKEEVVKATQIPRLKMPVKVDEPVILIQVIPMGHPQPFHEEEPP